VRPCIVLLQEPSRETVAFLEGSNEIMLVLVEFIGLLGTVSERLNAATMQPSGTVQFPIELASFIWKSCKALNPGSALKLFIGIKGPIDA